MLIYLVKKNQFLCIFPWIGSEIAWTSILLAMTVSGSVLMVNIHEVLKASNDWKTISPYLMGIAAVHVGLALVSCFKWSLIPNLSLKKK